MPTQGTKQLTPHRRIMTQYVSLFDNVFAIAKNVKVIVLVPNHKKLDFFLRGLKEKRSLNAGPLLEYYTKQFRGKTGHGDAKAKLSHVCETVMPGGTFRAQETARDGGDSCSKGLPSNAAAPMIEALILLKCPSSLSNAVRSVQGILPHDAVAALRRASSGTNRALILAT